MPPRVVLVALLVACVAAAAWPRTAATGPDAPADPAALYDRLCLACHGEAGDGRGPARPFVWPQPRDFARGDFKWRSTPSGQPPTDDDLARAIRHGVPGTAMPGFGALLGAGEIAALVGEVKRLSPREFAAPAAPMAVAAAPPVTPALRARGALAWVELGCGQCHGAAGRGDGPSARELRDALDLPAPPYDLTRMPLRRPRGPGESSLVAIYTSLVTGLDGTPMPSYDGAAPAEALWAVAAFVDSIRAPDRALAQVAGPLAPEAIALDRAAPAYRAGYWPGAPGSVDAAPFGATLALAPPPPDGLTPAQASSSAEQCARCHAEQARAWRGSLHQLAGSPGLIAQLIPLEAKLSGGGEVESCQRCHAPLGEQQPLIRPVHVGGAERDRRYRKNPRFDAALREEGVTCAACHVRAHQRLGPPRAPGRRLALPGYPVTELPIYQRADLCLPCHQLAPRAALNGRPLLDTYREWLEGPYMPRGVQCQHCHMPDREHSFKGIHDQATFVQGVRLDTLAVRGTGGVVTVRARLTNVGAGHFLPTTPTPAVWLRVALLDDRGEPIAGAEAELRIGRHLEFGKAGFTEVADTRIAPGASRELAAGWRDGRVAAAVAARVTVEVWPDEYYERLYQSRLGGAPAGVDRLYREALTRAVESRYLAIARTVAITAGR